MSVASVDQQYADAGIQIVWVLTQTAGGVDGTAATCESFMDEAGATHGLCVGDSQTEPEPGEFAASPFARGRGIDFAVKREDMVIAFVADHGTPTGNDNLTGEEMLEQILDL